MWDEKLDGTWVASTATTEDHGDGPEEGCWVTRGRAGVRGEMNYKDEFMDVQRQEATDEGLFGSERLNMATSATANMFNDADAKRKKKKGGGARSGLRPSRQCRSIVVVVAGPEIIASNRNCKPTRDFSSF